MFQFYYIDLVYINGCQFKKFFFFFGKNKNENGKRKYEKKFNFKMEEENKIKIIFNNFLKYMD